jgi:HEAT repeat protein
MSSASDEELAEQLNALGDEHRDAFGAAMQWLVEHPDRSRPALLKRITGNGEDMGTRRAFDVLGRIGNPDDVAALDTRLTAARGTLAADAAHGLALHPSARAREALVRATGSDSVDVAAATVSALGERGDAETRPAIEKLLDHTDPRIRYRAVLALIDLGTPPSRATLHRRYEVEGDAEVKRAIEEATRIPSTPARH